MEFDWDPNKAESNGEKHGISFAACLSVFLDPDRIEVDSSKPEHGETRIKTIGEMEPGLVVAVVFTDRGNVRRIISARSAKRNERRAYDQGKTAP